MLKIVFIFFKYGANIQIYFKIEINSAILMLILNF